MSLSSPPAPRVVLVALTKHGAAQAATLARQLPGAEVCVAAKFATAFEGLPHPVHAYSGAFKDEVAGLFARYDQIVCFISLGAVVRLIAPHLRSKDEDPGVLVVDDAADRKSTRLNSSHVALSRMPSSA